MMEYVCTKAESINGFINEHFDHNKLIGKEIDLIFFDKNCPCYFVYLDENNKACYVRTSVVKSVDAFADGKDCSFATENTKYYFKYKGENN